VEIGRAGDRWGRRFSGRWARSVWRVVGWAIAGPVKSATRVADDTLRPKLLKRGAAWLQRVRVKCSRWRT